MDVSIPIVLILALVIGVGSALIIGYMFSRRQPPSPSSPPQPAPTSEILASIRTATDRLIDEASNQVSIRMIQRIIDEAVSRPEIFDNIDEHLRQRYLAAMVVYAEALEAQHTNALNRLTFVLEMRTKGTYPGMWTTEIEDLREMISDLQSRLRDTRDVCEQELQSRPSV